MRSFVLAAGLAAYNNVVNLWPPFHGYAYVPVNFAAAAAVVAAGREALGLSNAQIGFGTSGGAAAAIILLGVAAGFIAAFRYPRLRRLLADERMAGTSNARLAYIALLRIPVGTAVLEEIAFRGVLFAAWRSHGTLAAAVFSSLAFGLWHITPTINLVRANRPGAAAGRTALIVGASVAATAIAGLMLVWLRVEGGSLAAPLVIHAAVNSCGAVAAVAAHRRNQQPDSSGSSGLKTR